MKYTEALSNAFARCVLCCWTLVSLTADGVITHASGERHQEKATLTSKSVSTYFSQHNDLL